jgi:serine/threonine protein kinase
MFNRLQVLDILEPVDGPSAAPSSAPAAAPVGSTNGLFQDLYVVLQDGGVDLHRYFQETSRKTHELREIKHISKQLCAAMSYLHSCRVVHRDLKSQNVYASLFYAASPSTLPPRSGPD